MVTGEIYHVMSKSIAGYQIFNTAADYTYLLNALYYFTLQTPPNKFSYFLRKDVVVQQRGFAASVQELAEQEGRSMQIIAYCLMPTHFHILVRQLSDQGISHALRRALNAYTRYFNIKHKRKGPLWMGRFKNVRIENDEQLLHVTRYLHINPVTAGLVAKPEEWPYSSYHEYLNPQSTAHLLTNHEGLLSISPQEYRLFCEDQISYQRELAIIKHQALE